MVCQFPIAFVQSVVPLGWFVAQRTSPVAEGYATIHASTRLELALACAQSLFHLSKIVYSVMNRTVASFLTVYSKKSFRISHIYFYIIVFLYFCILIVPLHICNLLL